METPTPLRTTMRPFLNPNYTTRQISPFKPHPHYRRRYRYLAHSTSLSLSSTPNSPNLPLGFLFSSLFSPTPSNSIYPVNGGPTFNRFQFKSDSNSEKFFHWHIKSSQPPVGPTPGEGDHKVAAVILGWLGARPKHLKRYAEMYNSRGADVIAFVVPVRDVLWFDLGRKVEHRVRVLTDEIVNWLNHDNENQQRRLIFHTFSNTGWLVYGAILGHLQERPDLIERIGGCIVDSGPDPELNPKVWAAGFAAALMKKRNTAVYPSEECTEPKEKSHQTELQDEEPPVSESLLHSVLEKLFSFLFKLPDVTQRLSKIISLLTDNQPPCPQHYLYSTADKVIPYQAVESFIERQKTKGRMVSSFNFESSPHVDHYRTFPDVYSSQVNNFLNDILATSKQK